MESQQLKRIEIKESFFRIFNYLERIDLYDFHIERQRLTGQRMIEIDRNLVVIEYLDHSRQFGIGCIVEDHQQSFRKLHTFKLIARHDLNILRIMLAKPLLWQDGQSASVASLEAIKRLFETWQQVSIANLERGGFFLKGTVDHFAIVELERKMQGDRLIGPIRCSVID